ncbi:MAG: type 1 periplasmic-binding domain-containing protein [Solirubrobacteraceae bacterium]
MSAGALATLALAGCGTAASSSNVTATGTTLTIYASAPTGAAGDATQADVLDAEQLAFDQKASQVTSYKLRFLRLSNAKLSVDARTAIEDQSAIAYLGELMPGSSRQTLGITNAQDLLQVSPTDTAVELTQATPAVAGAPNRYYEALRSYGRTFARVVPNTRGEAAALITATRSLGVQRLAIVTDGTPYGAALAAAVRSDASSGSPTIAAGASGADGLLFAGNSASQAAATFSAATQSNPAVKLLAPSALDSSAFADGPGGQLGNVYLTAPGLMPRALADAAPQFVSAFQSGYHHTPSVQAIFGYEAMSAVLDVLRQAGASASNRTTVVHAFFAIRSRSSALGTYSIDSTGDTSISPFVLLRLHLGQLVPLRSLPPQG